MKYKENVNKMWVINEILEHDAREGKYRYGYTLLDLQKRSIDELDKILGKMLRKESLNENELPTSVKRVLGNRF